MRWRNALQSGGPDALQAKPAPGRRAVVEKMITSMGGKPEALYHAFGETDLYGIADMPDDVSAAAFALTIAGS